MRVVYLIAGAGGMYCGSCMRDNRLAATLIEQGRDVVLLPLYTPIRTDERDVSTSHVYYGGINTYLQQRTALFRRTPWFVDSLFDRRPLLRGVGRLASYTRPESLGPMAVSVLRGAHGAQRKELKKLIAGLNALEPSLINLPNLLFVGVAAELKRALRVPIVCTLAGEDVFIDALPEPHRTEACRLIEENARAIDAFITPTQYYGRHAAELFRLDRARVHHAPMGVRVADFARTAQHPVRADVTATDAPFTIGYLARICPEKGLATLSRAFAELRRRETGPERPQACRLRIAGYLGGADRSYWQAVQSECRKNGAAASVEFLGEVSLDAKRAFLHSLDALCVPTTYAEAKGFYILEANAAGVPVVQPRHGAFPELIQATRGGLLYDVDPARAPHEPLAAALARLWDDAPLRAALARDGAANVAAHFSHERMAARTWEIYEDLCR